MKRFLLFAALLVSSQVGAATITSSTCTSSVTTGCSVSYVASFTTLTYVVAGTWTGTIVFEGSTDGSSYVRLRACPLAGGECVTSVSSTGEWLVPTGSLPYARVRATSWTSGTATVTPLGSTTPVPMDAVAVTTPDGGLPVNLGSATVSTTVTTPDGGLPVTLGAQRVAVEATGPGGDPVIITGSTTATLAPESIAALGPQPYTLKADDWVTVSSTTAIPVPPDLPDGGPGSLSGRTELRIVNASSTHEAVCDPATSDGGLPEWGVRGQPLFTNGGYGSWEVRDNVRVYCRARSGSATLAPLEKAQ